MVDEKMNKILSLHLRLNMDLKQPHEWIQAIMMMDLAESHRFMGGMNGSALKTTASIKKNKVWIYAMQKYCLPF